MMMNLSVWKCNAEREISRFKNCLRKFPMIAVDTEFPGTIYPTGKYASEEERYSMMKANIEATKLIQCGLTLFNANGEIGGTWEINFSNFNVEDPSDVRNESSIEFLTKQGFDLKKTRDQGVDMFKFFPKLFNLIRLHKQTEFVTFHGATDLGYILSVLNNGRLGKTVEDFVCSVEKTFGQVYDLKVMAGFCDGFGEHLGLAKVANLLKISRTGEAHHAGSDSLVTAQVFVKLTQLYQHCRFAKGSLYGIPRITSVVSPVDEEIAVSVPESYDSWAFITPCPTRMFTVPMNTNPHPLSADFPFGFGFRRTFASQYAPPSHYLRF